MNDTPPNCPDCGSHRSDTPTISTWVCGTVRHKGKDYVSELCQEKTKGQCMELSVKIMNEKTRLVVEAARKFKDSTSQMLREGADLMDAAEKEIARLEYENLALRKMLTAELKSEGI